MTAVSILGTVQQLAVFVAMGTIPALLAFGVLGWLTITGWAITCTAGPVAAIQLWRFRESGRRAGLVLYGFAVLYYVLGAVWLAALTFSLPFGLLLLPQTKAVVRTFDRSPAHTGEEKTALSG